jgi:hypothetical protein
MDSITENLYRPQNQNFFLSPFLFFLILFIFSPTISHSPFSLSLPFIIPTDPLSPLSLPRSSFLSPQVNRLSLVLSAGPLSSPFLPVSLHPALWLTDEGYLFPRLNPDLTSLDFFASHYLSPDALVSPYRPSPHSHQTGWLSPRCRYRKTPL